MGDNINKTDVSKKQLYEILTFSFIFGIIFIPITIFGFISIFNGAFEDAPLLGFLGLLLPICFSYISIYGIYNYRKLMPFAIENDKQKEVLYNSNKALYEQYLHNNNITDDLPSIIQSSPYIEYKVKIQSKVLCLYPIKCNLQKQDLPEKLEPINIPIKNIEYYKINGSIRYETRISGGGGGSSLTGAVVGGAIAVSTGAIIGSRKKVNEIKSKTVKKDDRVIELIYRDVNNKKQSMKFLYNYISVFKELIPEKEYSIYEEKRKRKLLESENNIPEQIKKLAELKDSGILTEEEFTNKKQELLARL